MEERHRLEMQRPGDRRKELSSASARRLCSRRRAELGNFVPSSLRPHAAAADGAKPVLPPRYQRHRAACNPRSRSFLSCSFAGAGRSGFEPRMILTATLHADAPGASGSASAGWFEPKRPPLAHTIYVVSFVFGGCPVFQDLIKCAVLKRLGSNSCPAA